MNDVKVTVVCLCYNHEAWVRDALEGFLRQDMPWPVEVLVHDDASTDGTGAVIDEYASRYPDFIFPFHAPGNLVSKGVEIARDVLMPYVRGEYVALCEGDDYWTDPSKLRRQVEALDARPECDICAHAALRKRPGGSTWHDAPRRSDCIIPAGDVILGGGGFVATSSLLVRGDRYREVPPFREVLFNDYSLQIWGSMRGGMAYLASFMSVYRQGLPGSWTSAHRGKAHMAYRVRIRAMLRALAEYAPGRFDDVIARRISLYDSDDLAAGGHFLRMLGPGQLSVTREQIRRNWRKLLAELRYRL